MQDRRLPSKIFLLSGLFGIAFSAIVLLLMHFVNVEFDPASRYISEYALGKFGTLAAVSFTIYGISVVMLFLWLNKFFSKKLKSGIGLKLILLFGITIIILGFFNTDPKTGQATLNGIIHSLSGGIGILSFSTGSLFISKKLKSNTLIILSGFSLFLIIFILLGAFADIFNAHNFVLPNFFQIFSDIVGLVERLYFLIVTIWILLIVSYIKK